MFLANYSDGLSDVNLDEMISTFAASDKFGCFLVVRPSFSMHLIE
jgi:glucose-1-phosphate cytidylyltransferase